MSCDSVSAAIAEESLEEGNKNDYEYQMLLNSFKGSNLLGA